MLGALQIRSPYARVDRKQAAFIKQVLAKEAEAVPEELARAIVFEIYGVMYYHTDSMFDNKRSEE